MVELADAVLCADGPVRSLAELSLVGEHRRGHGSSYAALSDGRGKDQHIMILGWPYSMVVALESRRSWWTAPLDAQRLAPGDDAATVTAAQLRAVITRLIAAGQWRAGDPDVLVVADAGYDGPRLAWLLRDLPVQVLARMRVDRVLRRAAAPRPAGTWGGHPVTAASSSSATPAAAASRTPAR